jgi:hypothetical protein
MASCAASPAIVDEEISTSIAAMVASDNNEVQMNGLSFALSLDQGVRMEFDHGPDLSPDSKLSEFWRQRAFENRDKHKKNIITAAAHDTEIRDGALRGGLITVEQALEMNGSLSLLLQIQPTRVFGIRWVPSLISMSYTLMRHPEDERSIAGVTAVGRHLAALPDLPWSTERASTYPYWERDEVPNKAPMTLDPLAYLGVAAVILIPLESALETHAIRPPDGESSWLGPFSALHPYIERRRAPESALPLPDLPVPEEFKQVFRDWAEGEVNFVGPAAGPEA